MKADVLNETNGREEMKADVLNETIKREKMNSVELTFRAAAKAELSQQDQQLIYTFLDSFIDKAKIKSILEHSL